MPAHSVKLTIDGMRLLEETLGDQRSRCPYVIKRDDAEGSSSSFSCLVTAMDPRQQGYLQVNSVIEPVTAWLYCGNNFPRCPRFIEQELMEQHLKKGEPPRKYEKEANRN